MNRKSKADAIRQARMLRADLLRLIAVLEEPGKTTEKAQTAATGIFERSRTLEYTILGLRRRAGG